MNVDDIRRWPSLSHQIELETRLFGRKSNALSQWCEQQLAYIDDQEFSKQFSDNVKLDGVAQKDFNHRLVETPQGKLLGGIRFFSLDIKRPFVEVIAHTFEDLDALVLTVANEWALFKPLHIRLTVQAGSLPSDSAFLDVSIHAATYQEFCSQGEQLNVVPVENVDEATKLVKARYRQLGLDNSKLGKNISPAEHDELLDCQKNNALFYFMAADELVGLIAFRDDQIEWVKGDEVVEEVVNAKFSGKGYAVMMQKALARRIAVQAPGKLLIGTIDRHNDASRKSAARAGRPEILRKVFLPLPL